MKRAKKLVAAVICLAIVAGMLFSACYAIHNIDHNCAGEDCQVCHFISFAKELFGSGFFFKGAFVAVGLMLCAFNIGFFKVCDRTRSNLVSNKVKLTA